MNSAFVSLIEGRMLSLNPVLFNEDHRTFGSDEDGSLCSRLPA